jgi:hypothetical protein
MSFANLKKNRGTSIESINKKVAEMNKFQSDDRFWSLTTDKSGTGEATIRFLPTKDAATSEDDIPFVRVWDHGFKGPGGWYIEKSLTSVGKDDPVSEWNSALWATDEKPKKDIVSGTPGNPGTKRRLHYIGNILVVNDPEKPENNGKVMLFKYGKKIFEKLNSAMNPKFATQKAINPFDMWSGVNLILRAHKEDGQRVYSQSEFEGPSPVATNDKDIEKIWGQTYSLKEFVDEKNFKTYDDLKARLEKVLRKPTIGTTSTVEDQAPVRQASEPRTKSEPVQQQATKANDPPWDDGEDDDELAQFRKLAE